jgi:hypothetical protein
MKLLISLGIALTTTQVWGQALDEPSDPQLLCAPFVRYAEDLVGFVEGNQERGFIISSADEARRIAAATIACAESGTRFLSRSEADAELALTQRQFEVGTNTSVAVRAAQVQVEKAKYCEAAFSYVTWWAETYDRRNEVGLGLTGPLDIAPILAEIETLVPVCGLPVN